MKCQILFPVKNKTFFFFFSKFHLLKILPRVQSIYLSKVTEKDDQAYFVSSGYIDSPVLYHTGRSRDKLNKLNLSQTIKVN